MKTLRQMAALESDEIFIKNATGLVLPSTSSYDGALLVIISKHFNRREQFFSDHPDREPNPGLPDVEFHSLHSGSILDCQGSVTEIP